MIILKKKAEWFLRVFRKQNHQFKNLYGEYILNDLDRKIHLHTTKFEKKFKNLCQTIKDETLKNIF